MNWPIPSEDVVGRTALKRFRFAVLGAALLSLGVAALYPNLRAALGQLTPAGSAFMDTLLCGAFVLLGALIFRAYDRSRAGLPIRADDAEWF